MIYENWIERTERECNARAYSCHLAEELFTRMWTVEVTFLRRDGLPFTHTIVEPWSSADYWRQWMRENRGA